MPVPPIVTDALLRESGRLSKEIGIRQSAYSPISAMIPKGTFEDAMGVIHNSILFQRGYINGGSWATVGLNSNDTLNNCNPTPGVVNAPSDTFPYQLEQFAVASQYLCLNDIRSAFEGRRQIDNLAKQMRTNILDLWADKDREEYIDASRNKLVFYGGQPIPGANANVFASVAADSAATPGLLADIYQRIIQDGGSEAMDSAVGTADSSYVFPILMSMEQARYLDLNDGQRNDLRWNPNQVGSLLQPFNVTRVRNGFAYTIDPKMPRYTFGGGTYTQVPYYITTTSTTGGLQKIINPAYQTAEYEDVIVFMKDVITREMPPPTYAAGEASFNPQKYGGEVHWLNILNQDENPLGNTGRFYALLQAAYRWENPYLGYVVKVKRYPYCVQKYNACSAS